MALLNEAKMNAVKSFSYSRLTTFFACARFWELQYIHGIRTAKTKAMDKGIELHKFYEQLHPIDDPNAEKPTVFSEHPEGKAIAEKFRRTYPSEYMKFHNVWRPYRRALVRGPLEYSEHNESMTVGLNTSPLPTVTLMGIMDYMNLNYPGKATVVDFKSGTHQDDPSYRDQAAIYALITMSVYPKINEVKTVIFDISSTQNRGPVDTGTFVFTRQNDYEGLYTTTQKMISSVIEATANGVFPASPCRKCTICPDAKCPYNKNWNLKNPAENVSEAVKDAAKEAALAEPPSIQMPDTPTAKVEERPKDAEVSVASVFGSFEIGDKERSALEAIKKQLSTPQMKLAEEVKDDVKPEEVPAAVQAEEPSVPAPKKSKAKIIKLKTAKRK